MVITSEVVREIFKGRLFPFTQRDAVEAAWFASTALLHQWAAEATRDFPNSSKG